MYISQSQVSTALSHRDSTCNTHYTFIHLSTLEKAVSWDIYKGSIPTELGNLTQLEVLYLYNNSLTGSIPSTLSQLKNSLYLNLDSNKLEGSIPIELGNLAQLYSLSLSNNLLTGSIPCTLGQLKNLTSLSLRFNKITGPIPVELGNLVLLEYLNLAHNSLFGSIPSEIAKIFGLWAVDLSHNFLHGDIPLFRMYSLLDRLDLSYNNLTVVNVLFLYMVYHEPEWGQIYGNINNYAYGTSLTERIGLKAFNFNSLQIKVNDCVL
ncbi:leucine-rich repeat receptor protein kinase [Spatholobus suberectus]|nr:leucine-rich repeat receptor protein kinase [Spatholobus suberectus]